MKIEKRSLRSVKGAVSLSLILAMIGGSSLLVYGQPERVYGTALGIQDEGNTITIDNQHVSEGAGLIIGGVDPQSYLDSYTYPYQGVEGMSLTSVDAEDIYRYLLGQGFTPASACGLLGNIERESSFQVDCGSESDVYGLFQMKGVYLTAMKNYCLQEGLDFYGGTGQVQAMVEYLAPMLFDLYTGKSKIYDWRQQAELADGSNHLYEPLYCWWYDAMTFDAYKAVTDVQLASEIWRRVIERNTGSAEDISRRYEYSQSYYQTLKDIVVENLDGGQEEDRSHIYADDNPLSASYTNGIIEEASRYIGYPYVWGGDSLTGGIDCSHFVCRILNMKGYYYGEYKNSRALRTAGMEVPSLDLAQPGDVLCYEGHVAFYVSPGVMLHAANSRRGIVQDSGVDLQNFRGGLLTIRRFTNAPVLAY